MKKSNKLYFVGLASILSLSLVACQSNISSESVADDSLVYVDRDINSTLDPDKPLSDSYLKRAGAAEALFWVNNKGEIENQLADKVEQIDDSHWKIYLNPKAKYWSGEPVTADKVIASYERSKEVNPSVESLLRGLTLTADSEKEISVVSDIPGLDVPLNLSKITVLNPDKSFERVDQVDLTGPYKIEKFTSKQSLELVRNDQYYGGLAKIEHVTMQEVSDEQSRLIALKSGQADIVGHLSTANAKEVEENPDEDLINSKSSSTLSVYLNQQRGPLADKQVRQALAWGTDRQALCDSAWNGYAAPSATWLGTHPSFSEEATAVYPKYDKAKAEALLDQAGWKKEADGIRYKDGQPLELKLMTWGTDKLLGESLQSQWIELGVKVNLNHVDYSVIEQARENGDWDGIIEAWDTFGDLYTGLSQEFSKDGSINYGKYDNPEVESLLNQLSQEGDSQRQHEIAKEINRLTAEDAPLIALMPRPSLYGKQNDVKGFEAHFMQFENVISNKLSNNSGN